MHRLEHLIPPPVVAILIALLMWSVSSLEPTFQTAGFFKQFVVIVLGLIGVSMDLLSFLTFRKAQTTINPLRPQQATRLITEGIFRISRNPMYVGLTVILLAWAVQLSALWSFFGPLLFVSYIQRFQIMPEERVLNELFGEEYRLYTQQVRRWL